MAECPQQPSGGVIHGNDDRGAVETLYSSAAANAGPEQRARGLMGGLKGRPRIGWRTQVFSRENTTQFQRLHVNCARQANGDGDQKLGSLQLATTALANTSERDSKSDSNNEC